MERIINFVNHFIFTAKSIINSPRSFFSSIKRERSFKSVATYAVALWLTGALLTAVARISWGYVLPLLMSQLPQDLKEVPFTQILGEQFLAALMTALGGLIISLMFSMALHGWLKLFGGKARFVKGVELYTYSLTPSLLFGWLPIAAIVARIYELYLLVVGAEELYSLNRKKSVIAIIVIPLAALLIISILLQSSGITLPTQG